MNCIIIDDEPLARQGIQLLVKEMPALHLLGSFSNAVEADQFIKANPVDLIFLDIQMPKINGMDYLRASANAVKVIITTAYPQFAVEAFELDVLDYLVKPVRFERFYKAVNRALKPEPMMPATDDQDYIFIRSERKYVRASYKSIDYIEGLKDYVIIYCGSEKHVVATNLKSIYAKLPPAIFTRINKSYIINNHKIKSIDSDFVELGNKQLPIGESFRKEIFNLVNSKKVLKR